MFDEFWTWLMKYSSGKGLQKLSFLKEKYLNSDAEKNIKYIHVTGTNGKGSVSRYLHEVLRKGLKLKVGLFTSPHILIVNERIIVNDEMISDQDLLRIKNLIIEDVDKYELGFFAILTLIALIYFQEQEVDWAIVEVGIGGLSDTTNIIRTNYAVLTSIAKDHSEILGKSLTSILNQKLGIVKQTTEKIFVSGNLSINLKQKITKTIVRDFTNPIEIYFSKKIIDQSYILENKTLAFLIASNIFPDFNADIIWEIIDKTKVNLRFQRIEFLDKTIYFDAAHNIAGIEALVKIIKLKNVKIDQIIFSALKTKKPKILIKKLSINLTNNILICQNNHPSSIDAPKFVFEKMIFEQPKNSTILITGSCYFVALVYQELLMKKKEYQG